MYTAKLCSPDYSCIANSCAPIDTDKDGLTDIEEKKIGTNINLFDSDGDTLGDYQETKIGGTNPLKMNTDDDRYNDNNDPNPIKKNSAVIYVTKSNEKGEYNLANLLVIGSVLTGSGLVGCLTTVCTASPAVIVAAVAAVKDLTIYTSSSDIVIQNTGDDYSSFVTFEVVYSIGNKTLERVPQSYGQISSNLKTTMKYSHDIKVIDLGDILGEVFNLLLGKSKINIEITDVQYEKF